MSKGLTRLLAGAALGLLMLASAVAVAQGRVDYLNGIAYLWPAAQGDEDEILTTDGAGGLSWADAPSAEGIWQNSGVLSTVDCPAGWTRVSAADSRVLRGADTAGGTGGSDTHGHTVSGVLGAAGFSVTGSSGSSGVSVSGSTGAESVSHSHSASLGTTGVGGSPPTASVRANISIDSTDPTHSHGTGSLSGNGHTHAAGSLAGGSHGHGTGSVATDPVEAIAAYYSLIVCRKD